MTQASTAIPADVRERIIAAAADLFEQSGRETMPTVDAVRRAARVDMNAASAVMKEWRRAQTAQAAPVAVPESVQQASSAAVATIWQQAQELANESLRSAQAAWETERGELDAMRQELAEAFERQAAELDAAGASLETERAAAAQQAQELAAVRQQLAKAEARIDEIEHRAADLRDELDRAHADADRLCTENTEARQQAAAKVEAANAATDAARAELVKVQAKAEAIEQTHTEQRKQAVTEAHRAAERMTKAQTERDDATKAAAEARERAAGLAGQVQAMQVQNAALLAAIKPQGEPKPKKTPPAKA